MTDLWQYLQAAAREGRPVVLYGMGNGADKILAVCEGYGIEISDFFASDGFVRGHAFHGKEVLSYSAMREKYQDKGQDPIVLLSFASSRPEVLDTIARVAGECELYVPDVPVCGQELFNAAFCEAHAEEIAATRALFADEESHRVYDGIIAGKLSGDPRVIRATESEPADAYAYILRADRFKTYCDLGAYNGDSIRALREHAPDLQVTLAMEPDRRNLRKLEAYAATLREAQDPLTVIPIGAGAWSEDTTLTFHGSGNRNAGLTDAPATAPADALLPSTAENPYFGKSESVPVRAPDSLLAECMADGRMPADTRVDFIKYDVEGAEREALLGSRAVIERDAPALLVSVYHRSGDLFTLPRLVHDLNPAYRLYLRRMAGLPAWDINLYAVVD